MENNVEIRIVGVEYDAKLLKKAIGEYLPKETAKEKPNIECYIRLINNAMERAKQKQSNSTSSINGDLAMKTLDILDSVDGEKALKKLKLTPLEHETARLLLREYWDKGETRTFYTAVANFFKHNGFTVSKADDNIDYIITA